MNQIIDLKNYMMGNRGESITLQNGYCMQIYSNGERMNISKETDGRTVMLCAVDAGKDDTKIRISFQKEDTTYEIGYDGEFVSVNEPLEVLCECRHPDGKIVYELLHNV